MSGTIARNYDKPVSSMTTLAAYIEAAGLDEQIAANDGCAQSCVAFSRKRGFKVGSVKWPNQKRRLTYKVSVITSVLCSAGVDHKAPSLKQCRAMMKIQKARALQDPS